MHSICIKGANGTPEVEQGTSPAFSSSSSPQWGEQRWIRAQRQALEAYLEVHLFLSQCRACRREKNDVTPKDVHILIPRVSECVILHDKREFVGVITLRILRREAYPGLSGTTGSL